MTSVSGLGWPLGSSRQDPPKVANPPLHHPGMGIGWPVAAGVSRETLGDGAPQHGSDAASEESSEAGSHPEATVAESREDSPHPRVGPKTSDHVSRETGEKTTPQGSPKAGPLTDDSTARHGENPGTLRSAPRPPHTRIITIANQKGGVGKTTTTVNLAAALAQQGLRVLVLDLDPQGNASTALGIPHHQGVRGIYDVLIEGMPLDQVVVAASSVDGVWCAPSTMDVVGCEIELVGLADREFRLRSALRTYTASTAQDQASPESNGYDYVLIDCPPSLGLLTINAFAAATEVLIPIQCEYYALEGLTQLVRSVELIQANLNPDLRVSTILMTMFDARTRLSAQVAAEVRVHFGEVVLATSIPRSVRISEAPSHGETVLTYDPSSVGALSYREVAVELTQRSTIGGSSTRLGQE